MDQQVKELWVEALRDPNRKQAIEKLEDAKTGAQCCLGVLCEVLIKNELMPELERFEIEVFQDVVNIEYGVSIADKNGAVLPSQVVKRVGLTSSTGEIPVDKRKWTYPEYYGEDGRKEDKLAFALSELNDKGYTFNQIADIIEEVF